MRLDSQYVCGKCGAVVCVAAHCVYTPQQIAALRAGLCNDCFGTRTRIVKQL